MRWVSTRSMTMTPQRGVRVCVRVQPAKEMARHEALFIIIMVETHGEEMIDPCFDGTIFC